MLAPVLQPFDYATVEPAAAAAARAAAERVRLHMRRTAADIIEIGRDLAGVKQKLGHGHFLKWIEAEFQMTSMTAQRFMAVAERFGKNNIMLNLPPTALYELASPSTPDEVREQIETRAGAGEVVTVAEIKHLKEQWAEERKGLRDQATTAKDKAKGAQASHDALSHHLSEMQKELASLRVERDTLRYELDRRSPAALVPPVFDTVEGQIEALLTDWQRVSPQAREEFLRRVNS